MALQNTIITYLAETQPRIKFKPGVNKNLGGKSFVCARERGEKIKMG